MPVKHTKVKELPRRLVLRCTECSNHILIPFTSDQQWLQRYLWLNGKWMLSASKDVVEGNASEIVLQPICAECQPEHVDPETLAAAHAIFTQRYEN